jgi:hypothetical protein
MIENDADECRPCACPACACPELTSLEICPACRVGLHADPVEEPVAAIR